MRIVRKGFTLDRSAMLMVFVALGALFLAAGSSHASQDVPPVVQSETDEPSYVPIEKRVKPDRPDRKHRHDEPMPQPDRQPGEGESVVTPDVPDADAVSPIEGREERDARRKAHHEEQERHKAEQEKLRQEREQYDREHPKPAAPSGLFGFVWSWVIWPSLSVMLAPFMWVFALIKWGGIVVLLILLAFIAVAIVLFGSVLLAAISWTWGMIKRCFSGKKDL